MKRGHRSAALQSHLFSTFCRNDGLPRCLWAKLLSLDFGCAVKCASRVDRCPAVQVAYFYPSVKWLEGVGNFLFFDWKGWFEETNIFCRQVSISKKLSSEEICQPSDGISSRDQEEMARVEYQVAPRSGHSPGMWKIKVWA